MYQLSNKQVLKSTYLSKKSDTLEIVSESSEAHTKPEEIINLISL